MNTKGKEKRWETRRDLCTSAWLPGKIGKNSCPGHGLSRFFWRQWGCRSSLSFFKIQRGRAVAGHEHSETILEIIVCEIRVMWFEPSDRPVGILGIGARQGDPIRWHNDKIEFRVHPLLMLPFLAWSFGPSSSPRRRIWRCLSRALQEVRLLQRHFLLRFDLCMRWW